MKQKKNQVKTVNPVFFFILQKHEVFIVSVHKK